MAEHKVGSMDITTQEKTFAGFLWFVKWGCILIAAILIFLALVNI
ncbi:aa3-type cytochrome c oxidase subunit IV [Falsirhodobacter xinxiangensis]|nr:aa3-type cytochrome c oxidase subunit IV [Rhodobacter xinxiangensis]MDH2326470.1 aa3-type cytochrome c oxidase subunit IV [Cereibacter flavus]